MERCSQSYRNSSPILRLQLCHLVTQNPELVLQNKKVAQRVPPSLNLHRLKHWDPPLHKGTGLQIHCGLYVTLFFQIIQTMCLLHLPKKPYKT